MSQSDDPYFQREQEKYENPVASREYLLQILTEHNKPLSFLEICELVNAIDEESRIGIQRRLRAMEREGQILFNRNKKYGLADKMDLIRGKVLGHRDGFGFLKRDDGQPDLFIHNAQMQALLHGDIVLVTESSQNFKGKKEARIVRIVEPRSEAIVGRFFLEHGLGLVVPDDSRICQEIIIPPEHVNGARQGHVVVVEIIQRPMKRVNAVGKIIEVLGEHMAPGMEIEMALRTFDIPHNWPKEVEKQVKGLTEQVPEEAKQGRVDLRQMPLVTIDGEDARDFDDAVYCEPLDDGGWQLWVAIADVSYYVRPGTALDKEAIERGNSVYFPEQVVPMLPEVLSNGLCSLNPQVDRLCMVCEMQVSKSGQLKDYRFYEAVMNSHARLTYSKVWDILQGDKELYQRYEPLVPHLRHLHDLFRALKKARGRRGAIEFETQENKFIFNAQRKIDHIVPVVRNDAHKMIEECMILANVSAANFLQKHQAEGLYRVHDKPDQDRLLSFLSYLGEVGIPHGIGKDPKPEDFSNVVDKIANRPDQELIQTMLLRSMKQAVYDRENLGHFGLALDAYAHFTSPIRRYPDLVVHRAIKAILDKLASRKSKTGGKAYSDEEVSQLGIQCSMTERRADDATRDVADWLKCEFMLDHVGDSFDGVIASVTSFGFFVRLSDFHIDGLVHISALENDYYHYDELKQHLIGENFGTVYRLGDQLRVKVAGVNLDDRKIDFVLDQPMGKGKGGRKVMIKKAKKPKVEEVTKSAWPTGGKAKAPARQGRRSESPDSEQRKGGRKASGKPTSRKKK
ncbi:ribonuclease R [Bowmanella yangjiangensis]|uniref:Ribonuclease R n=1 Tax=Bowmanella yangjiangensis TaxID=2811230 RepID=A0ABS3CXM9_9ALTE|nr:ribonuclease R [Bowmanella yangjiangensis]MBN7821887.1 ribonuclease R [Bowmanella yangjiangensis]